MAPAGRRLGPQRFILFQFRNRVGRAALRLDTSTALDSTAVPETMLWDNYKVLFGKEYTSVATEAQAHAAHDHNVQFILRHNTLADQSGGFLCGVNIHNDLSSGQFREQSGRGM